MKVIKYWKPILIALIIFYGSLTSNDNLNKVSLFHFEYSDKLIHFILYLILTITFQFSLIRNQKILRKHQIILSFIFVVSFGLIMEVLQFYFTSNRSAEILDALSNTLGCICGILILPFLQMFNISKYL
jgi:VanZ family protein